MNIWKRNNPIYSNNKNYKILLNKFNQGNERLITQKYETLMKKTEDANK